MLVRQSTNGCGQKDRIRDCKTTSTQTGKQTNKRTVKQTHKQTSRLQLYVFFHLYQYTDPSRRGKVGCRAPDRSRKWLTRRPCREEWRVVDQMEWRAQYASSRNRGSPPERKLTELPCGSKGCFRTFVECESHWKASYRALLLTVIVHVAP